MGSGRAAMAVCVVLAVSSAFGVSGAGAAAVPVVSNISGQLTATGPISGLAWIDLDVSDPAGVTSTALVVDGQTLQTSGNPGGFSMFSFNTGTVRDGIHQVAVTVTDGLGATTTVWQAFIETANAPLGGEPAVNGDDQVGQTLVAADGKWSPAASSYSYQWLRCNPDGSGCAPIAAATSPSYTLVPSDASDVLEIVVTATDTGGSTAATSAPSSPIAAALGSPDTVPALAAGAVAGVSGTAARGQTLTAQPGNWSGGPLTYAYQWQRCAPAGGACAAIAGATDATYTLTTADEGTDIRVLVSATGPGGTTQTTSAPTSAVGAAAAPAAAAGAPNGSHACTTAKLRARLGSGARVTVPVGRAVTLRGSLHCGANAIAGASVEVLVAPFAGSGPTRHATVRTDAGGAFTYVLGPGASRRVTLSYRAYAGESAPATQARATMLVRPSISLAITPTATTNGHTVTFTGTVSGGHEPAGGLTVEIEYRQGRAWMIYTTVRTGAGGAFVWRYTFQRTTESITYWFRVTIPASGVVGYPYQPAASAARSVHVRP